MEPLLHGLLSNAILVCPLALVIWLASAWVRRPALCHALWLLVLLKLVTPPLFPIAVVVDAARWPHLAAALPVAESVPANGASWPGFTIYSRETIERLTTVSAPGRLETSTGDQTPIHPSPLASLYAERFGAMKSLQYWNSPAGVRRLGNYFVRAFCLLVWLLGAVVALFVLQYRIALLKRILIDLCPIDEAASERAATLYGAGVRGAPPVILVDVVVSPTLVGCGRATRILFPRALWRSLSQQQRDTLLLHELAHFRRGDHWVRALEAVVSILFWWHPVVWFAKGQLRWHEELCCDAAAVVGPAERSRTYAEALLAAIDFISEGDVPHPPAWGTGVRPVRAMQWRIQQIMQRRVRSRLTPWARAAVILVALVALPTEPWLLGSEQQPRMAEGPTAHLNLILPFRF